MTMRERIEQGLLFTDGCEGLPEDRVRAKRLMLAFNTLDPAATARRARLLDEIFGRPTHAWVEQPLYFCYGYNITLGDGAYVNMNCTFLDDGAIKVGERSFLGSGVTLATVGHPVAPDMREYMYAAPVTIGADCWLGASVTVCPGVSVGDGSVIGAGSVVTRDVPAGVVAVGSPCRVLREIGEEDHWRYFRDRATSEGDLAEERRLRGGAAGE